MADSVNKNLRSAFRYLLKPLVRMAVKNGVLFPEFSEALRQAYVDVAAKTVSVSGREATDEEISLITNIDKSDVKAMRSQGEDLSFERSVQHASPVAIILGAWHTDPVYAGPYGVLRDLQLVNQSGSDRNVSTFTDLAQAHCPGVDPKLLLEELVASGAVRHVGGGFYRAVQRSHLPPPLSAQSIVYLARGIHNLSETLEFNMRADLAKGERLIERSIFTQHGIPRNQHPEFNKYIRERGQAFADDVDNWITARDVEGVKDPMHIGVGLYHYIVNDDDEAALVKELPH
jgi:hypothetical protein